MEWFFCLDDDERTFDLAKVAVSTCLKNTDLIPVCLFCGVGGEVPRWLGERGVRVIRHAAPVLAEIEEHHPKEQGWKSMYMRMDIHRFCDGPLCLYADVDVAFTGDCEGLSGMSPKYLAAAVQEDPYARDFFNNGVMLLNPAGMRTSYRKFLDFTRKRLKEKRFFDQYAYNEFYGRSYSVLPAEYNWKSYWPDDEAAWNDSKKRRTIPVQIIHYHGPKPWHAYGDTSWWSKWPEQYFNEHHERRAAEWFKLLEAA